MTRTHEDIQDEMLVLRCQSGDGDALRELVARWQPRLGRLAWRLTSHREAARDIVQDAWIAIVRGLRQLDDPATFRSWAYRIVSNKCADWTRRRVVQKNAAAELQGAATRARAEAVDAPHASEEVDDVVRLRNAMRDLPEAQHAILSLHYLDGMGVAEIARVLGVPAGTVKSRLHHARSHLRTAMERVRP